jgi:hypothetical protein
MGASWLRRRSRSQAGGRLSGGGDSREGTARDGVGRGAPAS